MATDGLIRKRQLAVPDSFDDTLNGSEVSSIETAADHMGEFLEGLLSQFKRILHGNDAGNWHDDPVTVFGSDVSLKALNQKEEIVEASSEEEETAAFDAGAKIVIRTDLL